MKINPSQISKLRLISQQLSETTLDTAQQMVSWFGAVQGQEYAQTKWALGLRLPKLSDVDIESELSAGNILRTHLLRPAWHFVTADDIYWLIKLTAPRVNAVNAYMYRRVELDARVFNKCNRIIEKLLQGNKHLTRDEINDQFKKNKIEAEGHRLSYIMMRAELDGIICSGARKGNQFTYALLEELVPKINIFNKEEALAEITKRYFQSRGPATIKDFSTWSGLTVAECKRGVEMNKISFEKMIFNNCEYYVSKPGMEKEPPAAIHLLPVYDEYIMGYKDRSAILEIKNALDPGSPFHYDCMIIYKGQIIGSWKRTIGKKQVDVQYQFLDSLTKAQKKEFDAAVKRFAGFNKMRLGY
jgi:hypothetical protein